MNILVFSWRDPKHPLAGGAEQVMHEHMKGWVEAGYGVTLFSSRVKGLSPDETLDGVKIIRRGDQFFGVKIEAFFYYLKKKKNVDIIVDQFHGIPFFTPLYVRKPKLAVLQEVTREVWFLYHLIPFPFSYLLGLLGYLSEPVIFSFYKNTPFMVGSASAKADLIKMGISENKITLVPHGVLIYTPKSDIKQEKVKTILFLGALARDKGIEEALKAFSYLNNAGEFQFWVIGRGSPEYQKKLLRLSRDLEINNKIKFWGFVSQEKKYELLSRVHILVNPSIREGWGLVNIEANSVGVPVVSYRSPGLVDSVKDGQSGVILKKNSPENMAKAIMKIFEKPGVLRRLQKEAKKWSSQYSWESSRKISLSLLKTLLARG